MATEAKRNLSLLFADTFSHEEEDGGKEELHLDLVQFPQPVCVREVRIIPSGFRYHPQSPDRYGKTQPASFKLDMFVRNLRLPDMSVFERLGTMEYSETDFLHAPKAKIVTDMFIVKGWYSSITVCAYGHVVGRDPTVQSPLAEAQPRAMSSEDLAPVKLPLLPRPEPRMSTGQLPRLDSQHVSHHDALIRPEHRPELQRSLRPDHHADHQRSSRPDHPDHQRGPRPDHHPEHQRGPQPEHQRGFRPEHHQEPQHGLRPDHHAESHRGLRSEHHADTQRGGRPEQHSTHDSHRHHQLRDRSTQPDRAIRGLLDHPPQAPGPMADYVTRPDQRPAQHNLITLSSTTSSSQVASSKVTRHEAAPPMSHSIGSLSSRTGVQSTAPQPVKHEKEVPADRTKSERELVPLRPPDKDSLGPSDLKVIVQSGTPDRPGALGRTVLGGGTAAASMNDEVSSVKAQEEDEGGDDVDQLPYDEMEEDDIGLSGLVPGHLVDLELFGDDETTAFNPYDESNELTPLTTLAPSHQTDHESELVRLQAGSVQLQDSPAAQSFRQVMEKMLRASDPADWLKLLEKLPELCEQGLAHALHLDQSSQVLPFLSSAVLRALDWSVTSALPMAVNIRQLKAGIRLFIALMECGGTVADTVLVAGGMEALLALLVLEHFASSIKVLVLRAVDVALDYSLGMEHFLGWSSVSDPSEGMSSKRTGYRTLLSLLLQKQTVRVMQYGRVLLKKAHAYELLSSLQAKTDAVAASARVVKVCDQDQGGMEWQNDDAPRRPSTNGDAPQDEPMDTSSKSGGVPSSSSSSERNASCDSSSGVKSSRDTTGSIQADADSAMDGYSDEDAAELVLGEDMALELANFAVSCLGKLCAMFRGAEDDLVQLPPKVCPTTCRLVEFRPRSPWPALIRWCKSRRFLDVLLVILSSPQLAHPDIFAQIRDILLCFLEREAGLLYLSENYTTTTEIIRVLTQTSEADMPISRLSLQDVLHNPDACTSQNLGVLLLYHLQSLKAVDTLAEKKPGPGSDLDVADVLTAFHLLFTIVFTPIGRYACSHVLTLGKNLGALLPYALPTGDEDWDKKLNGSVACNYVRHLLPTLLQTSENKQYLHEYSEELLKIADAAGSLKDDLKRWLEPVRCLQNAEADHIAALVKLVHSTVTDLSAVNLSGLPTLVIALRLLQHACCPPGQNLSAARHELCWKGACLSLLSANAIEVLYSTGEKLCEIQEPLWLQGHLVAHPSHSHFLSAACAMLSVLLELLHQLSTTQGLQFCDTRLVTMATQLHSIMCCAQAAMLSTAAQQVQVHVVQILATYTRKPSGQLSSNPENAETQPWYMMLDSLLTFIEKSPQNFIGGLVLLSELLPLPLPIAGAGRTVVEEVLTRRQLWSAQLSLHSSRIGQLISKLSDTSCGALAQQLRHACFQLADVDSTMALVVVRPLLELLTQHNGAVSGANQPPSVSSRVLSNLASLLPQPTIKAAALYALRVDDASPAVINSLITQVSSPTSNAEVSHLAVSILQALLDPLTFSIGLQGKLSMQQLANSLPPMEITLQILSHLQEHLAGSQAPYATVLSVLRLHTVWVQHQPLLALLYSRSGALRAALTVVLQRLCTAFRPGSSPTSDEMSTLSTMLELLHLLCCGSDASTGSSSDDPMTVEDGDTAATTTAADKVNNESADEKAARLHRLLAWTNSSEHPLCQLAATLAGSSQEEDGFGAFSEALQVVMERLNAVSAENVAALPTELTADEVIFPSSLSLADIFKACAVQMSVSEAADDSQLIDFWLHPPLLEDVDNEADWVERDLLKLAQQYCAEWSLEDEIKNRLAATPSDSASTSKRSRMPKRKFDPLISRIRSRSQPVPLRGRGRLLTQKLQRSDMYRSRKQNTSRPPSMHVDDFVVLEGEATRDQGGRGGGARGGGRGAYGRGMRRGGGNFGGRGGRGGGGMHGGGGGVNMASPFPYGQGSQRMHGRGGGVDMRQPPMDGPPGSTNRITLELQRILNNLPGSPGANRWPQEGMPNMPPASPWQSNNRQSNYGHKPWGNRGGSSQMGHAKRQEWPGHSRRLSLEGGGGGGGYMGGMPRSDNNRPSLLGGRPGPPGPRHDSRHQRNFTR